MRETIKIYFNYNIERNKRSKHSISETLTLEKLSSVLINIVSTVSDKVSMRKKSVIFIINKIQNSELQKYILL